MFTKSHKLFEADPSSFQPEETAPFHMELLNDKFVRVEGYHDYAEVNPLVYRAASQINSGIAMHPLNPTYDGISQIDAIRSLDVPEVSNN